VQGTRWRSWLRHCTTSRKVAGSIPDGVIGIFYWYNPSGRTVALGLTQPVTEMGKGGRCVGLITLPPSCTDCLEIWEPQPPGTLRACPGMYRDSFIFRDSAVGIATCYGLDGPGIESRWGEIFRTCPDRSWGPPSLLYIQWVPVLSWDKVARAWSWPPTPSGAEVKERVEIYLHCTSGPLWSVLEWSLPLPLLILCGWEKWVTETKVG
jgi:hypothetical protein